MQTVVTVLSIVLDLHLASCGQCLQQDAREEG